MSKVQIEIPDDRWFRGEWQIRPQDKQLCVAILVSGGIKIVRYRETLYGIKEVIQDLIMPLYLSWSDVDRWKPLELPTGVNERVLAEIEKWFEEDE